MYSCTHRCARKFVIAVSAVVSALLFLPGLCAAAPREVTLFPASASVTEVAKVALQPAGEGLKKAVFRLPGTADPDSLVTQVPAGTSLKIVDQRCQKISFTDDERVVLLRRQIQEAGEARATVSAALQSFDVQMQFWQLQTKAKVKNTAEALNTASLIGKSIRRLAQDKFLQERELEKIDRRLAELKEELERVSGRRETAWEVTVTIGGALAAEATLMTTYTLANCGWRPLYRLDAQPASGRIVFSWEAEIWQSSGRDWHQAALSLATLQPMASLAPPAMPPWIIQPTSVTRVHYRMDAAEAAPEAAVSAPPAVPHEERKSTYALWRLGKIKLPAGSRQILKITEKTWPAVFTRVTRPSRGPQVFLQASASLPHAEELPKGEALFLIDGAFLGKRSFALAGKEESIFFGVDPLVRADIEMLAQKAGETSFLSGKQSHEWEWRIKVRNTGSSPVSVRVEEPKPQVRDERIRLAVTTDPLPSGEDPMLFTWVVTPEAGASATIHEKIRIEAPKELDLDLGWRK